MLAPSLLPHLASQTELLKHQMQQSNTCKDKMRSSPGPSYSNNDSHDVTGIAPSALGDGAKSVQQGGEVARSGTRPIYEDCQCSADSLNPSTKHAIPSSGTTNTRALQAPHQRMPFFPEAPLPSFAKAPEPVKPSTAYTGGTKSYQATSSSDVKRSRAMDYKKSRMVWSEDLHTQFLRALSDIGLRHAVPKTIMQRMGVDTLTRENVASHLQKYRLALKRKANLPDNALMTASSWRLLEQAHDDVVNNLPPPAAPAAPLSAAALNIASHNVPSPSRAGASSPAAGSASKASGASGGRASAAPLPPLPPLMPSSSAVPTLTDLANVSAALHNSSAGNCASTLPPGYSVPLPNAEGIAVGIPMPLHFLPKGASGNGRKASSLPPMASSAQGSLPDLPSGACALKVEPNTQHVNATAAAECPQSESACAAAAGTATGTVAEDGTAATDPLCTVYMLDPSTYGGHQGSAGQLPPLCGPHQGHSLMKATQVPQMLLSVSAAAYGNVHGVTQEGGVTGATIAPGAPAGEGTLSSGSASKPDAVDDEEASPPKRRRRVSVRVERLPGEEDLSPRRAKAKVPRTGGSGSHSQPTKGGVAAGGAGTGLYGGSGVGSIPLFHPAANAHFERAVAREPDFRGSCSALDALAEVAGRFAMGEEM